jgi:hypothetical protein
LEKGEEQYSEWQTKPEDLYGKTKGKIDLKMSDPSKYPNFTAADIERYHSGKMTDRERNAIEKAALEDPFLSDALEGYLLTSTPVVDLDSLKNRLAEKTSKKKYTIPFFRHNQFMKVAAIILLMAGAGWFITQLNSSSEKDMAVRNKQENLPVSSARDSNTIAVAPLSHPGLADSISATREVVIAKPVPVENGNSKTYTLSNSTKGTLSNATKGNDDVAKAPAKEEAGLKAEIASAPPVTMKAGIQQKDTTFSIAATDIYGVEIKGDTIKNLNIVMVENDQTLNEVVVLNRRKDRPTANQAKPIEEIEPIGGWEGYNNYALNNLKPPEGYDNKLQTGDVVLSFDINKEGEPTNIKVVESYCSSCEKEAKRILQEGPKWKNKNKQNAKIRIRF